MEKEEGGRQATASATAGKRGGSFWQTAVHTRWSVIQGWNTRSRPSRARVAPLSLSPDDSSPATPFARATPKDTRLPRFRAIAELRFALVPARVIPQRPAAVVVVVVFVVLQPRAHVPEIAAHTHTHARTSANAHTYTNKRTHTQHDPPPHTHTQRECRIACTHRMQRGVHTSSWTVACWGG